VPGSHHAQFTGVLHRQHAVVEDGVRTAKSMGLRNLPSKTWMVNCGWVLAANLAADLSAWIRLLGLYDCDDCDDLADAEPDTLRYRLLSLPARLVRHARQRVLKISRTWPWKQAFLTCWQRLCTLPAPPDQPIPSQRPGKEAAPAQSEPVPPEHTGPSAIRRDHLSQIQPPKTGTTRSVTNLAPPLNR
jgi:hypothetical protein